MNKNRIAIFALVALGIIFGVAHFYPLFTFGANFASFLVIIAVVALVLLLDGIFSVGSSDDQ